jgi:C_GCAxxG_C_C family probable redox protein
MMKSTERARSLFAEGTNCAQAVFIGCSHGKLGQADMLRLSSCFGGGMSHTDHACGALTGGLMAIGAELGMERVDDAEGKRRAGEAAERFVHLFRERFGATRCTELIKFDLSDNSQLEAARSSGVFAESCPAFVEQAVELVESVLQEQEDEASH